jgi:hypothetical protein
MEWAYSIELYGEMPSSPPPTSQPVDYVEQAQWATQGMWYMASTSPGFWSPLVYSFYEIRSRAISSYNASRGILSEEVWGVAFSGFGMWLAGTSDKIAGQASQDVGDYLAWRQARNSGSQEGGGGGAGTGTTVTGGQGSEAAQSQAQNSPTQNLGYLPNETANQIQALVDEVGEGLYVVGGVTYRADFNDIDYAAYEGGPWEAYDACFNYGSLPGAHHSPFALTPSWGIQEGLGAIYFQPGASPQFFPPYYR